MVPISRKSKRTDDRELARAVRFLSPMMTITAEGVVAAAYFSTGIILILSLFLLTIFGVNLFITIPLSIMASSVSYTHLRAHETEVNLGLSCRRQFDFCFFSSFF